MPWFLQLVHYISIHMTAFLWGSDRKVHPFHPVHPYNDLFLFKMHVFDNNSSFQCIYVQVQLFFFGILGKMNVATFRDVNMPIYTYTFHIFFHHFLTNEQNILYNCQCNQGTFIAYTSLAITYKQSKDMMKLCWSIWKLHGERKFSIHLYVVINLHSSSYELNSAYDTISAAVFWCIIFCRCPERREFCPSVKLLRFQKSQKRGQWNDLSSREYGVK